MRQLLQDAVDEEAEMDMTPMIDVVFLLIIFFLCIDFRILEAKLPVPNFSAGGIATPADAALVRQLGA